MGLGAGELGDPTTLTITPELELPPEIIWRCRPPETGRIEDFDRSRPGNNRFAIDYWVHWDEEPTPVVEPAVGTVSEPYALSIPLTKAGRFRNRFTSSGLRYVGMHVGLSQETSRPVTIRLIAYDGAGAVLDMDEVQIQGPHPATQCLVARVPTGTESIMGWSLVAPGVDELIVDKTFWGTDPYPVRPEPVEMDVEILFPPDGFRYDAARTTAVLGEITFPAPVDISRVNVAYPTWDARGIRVRTATLAPRWDFRRDGLFHRLFWLEDVQIAPGDHRIVATALSPVGTGSDFVEVSGLGAPAPPPDIYLEDVADEVDIRPWALEVTQAVRGPLEVQGAGTTRADDFNHAAGKRTVVRGYAVQQFPSGAPPRIQPLMVGARLHGSRDGAPLPGSPLTPEDPLVEVLGFEPGERAESGTRPFLDRTWNFVLPYTWTTGNVQLRLEVNPPGPAHIDEHRLAGGRLNLLGKSVTFTDIPRVAVAPIAVEYFFRCTDEHMTQWWNPCSGDGMSVGDTVSDQPSREDIRRMLGGWWKTIPVPGDYPWAIAFSELQVADPWNGRDIPLPGPTIEGRIASLGYGHVFRSFLSLLCDDDVDEELLEGDTYRITLNNRHVFGFWVTPPEIGGGCAWVRRASYFRTNIAWATAAQEGAHTAGLRHSSNAHGELGGGSALIRWDGDHGELGPASDPTYGFDTDTMTVIRPFSTGSHAHDYMSYGGGPIWTSVAVWDHMFRTFVNDRGYGDDRGRAAADKGERSEDPRSASGDEEVLQVSGVIEENGNVRFAAPLLAPRLYEPPAATPVMVELLDADGNVLASAPAIVDTGTTHSHSPDRSFLAEFLDPPHDLSRVRVSEGDQMLGERSADGAAEVRFGDGSAGRVPPTESDAESVTFSWEGSGTEFLLEAYRPDIGWWPLVVTDQTTVTIPRRRLPLEGDGWTIRVQAHNGVEAVGDQIEGVDLGAQPPQALITAPADGAAVSLGLLEVSGAGATLTPEDETTYTWLLDGDIVGAGIGSRIPVVREGEHVLRLEVANSAGTASDEIRFTAGFDLDDDGIPDHFETSVGLDPSVPDDIGADPDDDGLATSLEVRLQANPLELDSDRDGFSDGVEYDFGSNPTDPGSRPAPRHGSGEIPPRLAVEDDETAEQGEDAAVPLRAWIIGASAVIVAMGGAVALRSRRRS